ncbi:MAG TPA: hypothetical protein VK106_04270, partial [Balneolaceae bacterium]|nr:hypothetical protein [Balneolaceae bacterium]
IIITACSTQPKLDDKNYDLSGTSIFSFVQYEGTLYTSTSKGLYRKEKTDKFWTSLGLQEKKVLDVVFIPGGDMVALVRINDFSGGIPSLYLSKNGGQSWRPYMNNFGGKSGKYTKIGSIVAASQPSDTLLAFGASIARSVNAGKSWELIAGDWNAWGGSSGLLVRDPYHPCHLWGGGTSAILTPILVKSEDCGGTWRGIQALKDIESITRDVVVKPTNADVVLVGFTSSVATGNVIRKSIDRGKHWFTVLDSTGVFALEQSVRDPVTVYAAGGNRTGRLFFYLSPDFGKSWKMVKIASEENDFRVNDIISIMKNDREVLYLGTNKGIYSYTFER